jgi:hypothetical protein
MAPAIKAVRGEQPHRHVSFACFVSVSPRTAGSWDRDTARHDTAVTRGRRLPDPAGTARGSLAYGNEGAGRPRPRGPPDRHRRLRRRARGELAPSCTCLLLCFHAGRDGRKGKGEHAYTEQSGRWCVWMAYILSIYDIYRSLVVELSPAIRSVRVRVAAAHCAPR